MTRAKRKPAEEPADDLWAFYQSIQLTPEQKAAARKRLEEQTEDVARSGVAELFLELEGKVHLDLDFYRKLREDDD
jgi:hypothetical protein